MRGDLLLLVFNEIYQCVGGSCNRKTLQGRFEFVDG